MTRSWCPLPPRTQPRSSERALGGGRSALGAPVLALRFQLARLPRLEPARWTAASPACVSASGTLTSASWRPTNKWCHPSFPQQEEDKNQPPLRTAPSNFGNCSQLAGTQQTGRLLGDGSRLRAAGGPALHQLPRLRGARRRRRRRRRRLRLRLHRARGARSEPLVRVSRSEGIAAPQGTRPDRSQDAAARRAPSPLPSSVTSPARLRARAGEGWARGGRAPQSALATAPRRMTALRRSGREARMRVRMSRAQGGASLGGGAIRGRAGRPAGGRGDPGMGKGRGPGCTTFGPLSACHKVPQKVSRLRFGELGTG